MELDITTATEQSAEDLTQITCQEPTSGVTMTLAGLAGSDSESENDNPPVRIPRGKLLSCLLPPVTEDSSASEDNDNGEGAYERMKKRLMAGATHTEPGQTKVTVQQGTTRTTVSSSSEGDDAPVQAHKTRRFALSRAKASAPPRSPTASVRSRQSSPGLFVTPGHSPAAKKLRSVNSTDDDSDAAVNPIQNADLEERVKRIRAERLAKQTQHVEKIKRTNSARLSGEEESGSSSDGENSRRLTQQSKPTRRAGKKAREAMIREQEKIRRGMQLTHQAKIKKRYSTKDLFAKMGYNQDIETNETNETVGLPTPHSSSHPPSLSPAASRAQHTPPTSPPSLEEVVEKVVQIPDVATPAATALQNPSASSPVSNMGKGKARAPEFEHLPPNPLLDSSLKAKADAGSTERKQESVSAMVELSDSEDELGIVQPKSRFAVFDRLPEKTMQEAPALLHLRHLAHLTSPSKKGPKGRDAMNNAELQARLAQKARQQAQKERQEKIEELRRKGIHIETEEEREKRQMEVEDMVARFEKQRQEDLKLAKLEREEAKKNGESRDELLSSDESEDDDYVASGDENAAVTEDPDESEEEVEVELSGSEDEELEEADEEDLEDGINGKSDRLLDDMAEEDDHEAVEEAPLVQQAEDDADMEDTDDEAPACRPVASRVRKVIVDEEDETEGEAPRQETPTQTNTQDNALAAFGFGNQAPTLGLTQAFAGTMANMQDGSQYDLPVAEQEQDSLDFLRSLPDTQPGANFSQGVDLLVPNSQTPASPRENWQQYPSSQFNLGISQLIETSPAYSRTQLSDIPEPTQDAGFLVSRSFNGIAPPPSTVDTVMMPVAESPIMGRKGKLRRKRQETPIELSDNGDNNVPSGSETEAEEPPPKAEDVFSVMKKAAKKQRAIDSFNKKTSWAKDAVEEQAEESEDEYAGLGGASDDDSADEVDEELAKMIDTNDVKVDERQLAAYFAEKAKKDDEKNINQLYKDIMSGNLRKRAGADAFDISDDEDEAEMRRRKKRAQFRQMTKALIADERIGKIAEDAKKAAFFKTFMDHFDDPEYEFLNAPEESAVETSQSQSEENKDTNEDVSVPDSQATSASAPLTNPLKRKSPDSQDKENRPPPHLRRTAASDALTRKPMSLADVQHSVSELLEDPRMLVPDSQYATDSDSEAEAEAEALSHKAATHKQPVVDRLTLSRTSTSSESPAETAHMAFHASSAGAHYPGFRVPSLLRRATSNFSNVSERSSSGASTPAEGGVRRGGTGRSNIHAQAREAERRAMLERAEKKRKDALKKKVGKARGKRSVLSVLEGRFE